MKSKYITLSIIISVLGALTGLLLLSDQVTNDNASRDITNFDHSALPEVGAVQVPLDIQYYFKSWEKVGDAEISSSYLKIDDQFVDPDQYCEECTRIEYNPGPLGIAGLAYKADTGIDLKQANKVSFYARGEVGGEKVEFKAAGKNLLSSQTSSDSFKNQKFAVTTQDVILSKEWQKYEIDLSGADLTEITHPFGFEITKGKTAGKIVFYLMYIIYDTEPAKNPLP